MDEERGSRRLNWATRARPNLRLEVPNMPSIHMVSVTAPFQRVRDGVSSRLTRRNNQEQSPEAGELTPKSPAPRLGLSILTRSRSSPRGGEQSTRNGDRSPTSTHSVIDPSASSANTMGPLPAAALARTRTDSSLPPPAQARDQRRGSGSGSGVRGADVHEDRLLTLMGIRRSRRRRSNRRSLIQEGRNMMQDRRGCTAGAFKRKSVRRRAVNSLLLGVILGFVLAIYLALAVTQSAAGQEFHVLLVMIVLVITIFFCHSVIRLCMQLLRREKEEGHTVPEIVGAHGYAQPDRPIPIHLARDEESAIESALEEPNKPRLPPPAYGLWRSSVRINPNLVHWQRVETSGSGRETIQERPVTANRPPSYISEDGVEYVVEAQPRSTAYETQHEMQLPIHPSERGRLDHVSDHQARS